MAHRRHHRGGARLAAPRPRPNDVISSLLTKVGRCPSITKIANACSTGGPEPAGRGSVTDQRRERGRPRRPGPTRHHVPPWPATPAGSTGRQQWPSPATAAGRRTRERWSTQSRHRSPHGRTAVAQSYPRRPHRRPVCLYSQRLLQSPVARARWCGSRWRRGQVEQDDPSVRARTYCPASTASAISASAAMIAKPRARKMLPADATTLAVPTTGAIPIMIA
jgi:hypothetical protein